MKRSTIWLIVAAVALALVGVLTFERWEGAFVALLSLLPSAKRAVTKARSEGQREQAEATRAAAEKVRAGIREEWKRIDTETAAKQADARKRWEAIREAPTQEDEDEMLGRFEKKGGDQ